MVAVFNDPARQLARYSSKIVRTSSEKEVMVLVKADDESLYRAAYIDMFQIAVRLSPLSVAQVQAGVDYQAFKASLLVR